MTTKKSTAIHHSHVSKGALPNPRPNGLMKVLEFE